MKTTEDTEYTEESFSVLSVTSVVKFSILAVTGGMKSD
jgi:hypothetical protein